MRFLLYLAVIGVAVYILIALIQARGRRPGGGPGVRRGPGPRPRGPVAPDDDPAFLAELDRRRREAERRARQKRGDARGDDDADDSAAPPGSG